MSGNNGAEFGKAGPVLDTGALRVGGFDDTVQLNLGNTLDTLENGPIVQVSPEGAFQPGQQVLFYLTVYNGPAKGGEQVLRRVNLKPWWKRVTLEKRGPGDWGTSPPPLSVNNGWTPLDEKTFGSGPVAAAGAYSTTHAQNNRLVWFPVPKLLDITQYQAPNPPPVAPDRQSQSLFLDDVWTLDLQDPNDPAYAATQGLTQPSYGRSASFLYISHGYALGLTHSMNVTGQGTVPDLRIDLTWITGTL